MVMWGQGGGVEGGQGRAEPRRDRRVTAKSLFTLAALSGVAPKPRCGDLSHPWPCGPVSSTGRGPTSCWGIL